MPPIYLLCLAAPCGLYFLPYAWVLNGVGILTVAAALPVFFPKEGTNRAQDLFISSAAFFAALAVNRQVPALAYSALALWGVRRVLSGGGLPPDMPWRRFAAIWLAAFAPLALGAVFGEMGLLKAAAGALALAAGSRVITECFSPGSRGMTGEAAAAALMALIAAFRPENLVFLNNPFWGVVFGAFGGIFFFRLGLLNRFAAWLSALCGTLFYVTAGQALVVFYFLFIGVLEMGNRLPFRDSKGAAPGSGDRRAFAAASLCGAALALLSAGAPDPFPYFFAVAGGFSAAVFGAWAGGEGLSPRRLLFGFWGSALLAACGWLSFFYPAGAAPLVMFSGFAAAAAYFARGILASPENDRKWLEYTLGALTAAFLFKALTPYLA